MPDRDLHFELTLRNAEIIRLKDINIILQNSIQNDENLLNKARKTIALLKQENAESKKREKELEIADIEVKVLLDELEKIDPLQFI